MYQFRELYFTLLAYQGQYTLFQFTQQLTTCETFIVLPVMNLNLNLTTAAFAQVHAVMCQDKTNHAFLQLLPTLRPIKRLLISGYSENFVAKV